MIFKNMCYHFISLHVIDCLFLIKLLIVNKLIICALVNLHCQISREKFEPEPRFEPRTSGFLARGSTTRGLNRQILAWAGMRTRIAQVAERRARNPEVRGSNFSLETWYCLYLCEWLICCFVCTDYLFQFVFTFSSGQIVLSPDCTSLWASSCLSFNNSCISHKVVAVTTTVNKTQD